jgi:hypothetical protein
VTTVADAHALEAALSALTAVLPDLPEPALRAHAAEADALAAAAAGATAELAATLARALRCYADGQVPYEGWALVASSAHTLARAIAEPGGGHAGGALVAARFELESLLPSPDAAAAAEAALRGSPDVPLTSLRRRS